VHLVQIIRQRPQDPSLIPGVVIPMKVDRHRSSLPVATDRAMSDSRQQWATRVATIECMTTTTRLLVQAIAPDRLADIRAAGSDGHGNHLQAFAASGRGEPLRCCLRYARSDEQIMLISFAPFDFPSVWTEVGPVYVHAARCHGYVAIEDATLPFELRTGPAVLRTYDANGTMNYDHNNVVTGEADLLPIIERLLGEPDVSTVHVRTLAPQCFLYSVVAG
jgi:hypothetical protein